MFFVGFLHPDKQYKEQHCTLKFFQCKIYLMLYGAH